MGTPQRDRDQPCHTAQRNLSCVAACREYFFILWNHRYTVSWRRVLPLFYLPVPTLQPRTSVSQFRHPALGELSAYSVFKKQADGLSVSVRRYPLGNRVFCRYLGTALRHWRVKRNFCADCLPACVSSPVSEAVPSGMVQAGCYHRSDIFCVRKHECQCISGSHFRLCGGNLNQLCHGVNRTDRTTRSCE